jgi:hypothetical protein
MRPVGVEVGAGRLNNKDVSLSPWLIRTGGTGVAVEVAVGPSARFGYWVGVGWEGVAVAEMGVEVGGRLVGAGVRVGVGVSTCWEMIDRLSAIRPISTMATAKARLTPNKTTTLNLEPG